MAFYILTAAYFDLVLQCYVHCLVHLKWAAALACFGLAFVLVYFSPAQLSLADLSFF